MKKSAIQIMDDFHDFGSTLKLSEVEQKARDLGEGIALAISEERNAVYAHHSQFRDCRNHESRQIMVLFTYSVRISAG